LAMLVMIFLSMSFLFPYAGERGGFFHSLSSLQVLLWALAPVGLESIIQWGIEHKGWNLQRAWNMFGVALVVTCAALSFFIMAEKLANVVDSGIPWNETLVSYEEINQKLINQYSDIDNKIMVNDPPGFTLATNRNSLMIPTNGSEAILAAATRYNVRYLAVNNERKDVGKLIVSDKNFSDHLSLLFETGATKVYEIKP
jgi:hypothetical protein